MVNPASSNVLAGNKAKRTECGSRIFIAQVTSMTKNVLHGESPSVLGAQGGALTSQCQLNMRAGLDRAQAHTSGVFGVSIDTCFLVAGNRATRAKKVQASIIAYISAVLFECALAPGKAE